MEHQKVGIKPIQHPITSHKKPYYLGAQTLPSYPSTPQGGLYGIYQGGLF